MNQFTQFFSDVLNGINTSALAIAIVAVAIFMAIIAVIGLIVSIILAIKYVKYNHRKNSAGITGMDAARKILDEHGLQKIKVRAGGSLIFGNSYSHYFKKVRLRRLTKKKTSISSLAMGAQQASLAVLDCEGDKDMKKRVKLIPIMVFGPFAFIPLLVIGLALDLLVFKASASSGIATILSICLGLLFYILAIIFSLMTLKTEKKAQKRACQIIAKNHWATADEIEDIKALYKLYNIEYINNLILSILDLILFILKILAKFKGVGISTNA